MKKFDLKPVGEFVGEVCKIVGYGVALALPCAIVDYVSNKHDTVTADYGGAVEAIMKSDMLSNYQQDAIEALKPNGTTDYYKAVIHIAYSSALDNYKADMIKNLPDK